MIDRVTARLGRRLVEVPVGFKYFVEGLRQGTLGLAGEESAGASFLGRDGAVWTTDKDGLIMGLLAAEMLARTGRDPGEHYDDLTRELGEPFYARLDAPATPEEKAVLQRLSGKSLQLTELAGEPIEAVLTTAPGDGEPIGGIKIITEHGWCAARPSGTEAVYKLYAESFKGSDHLRWIQEEAQAAIRAVFRTVPAG
jgi:phosphoglucomutase